MQLGELDLTDGLDLRYFDLLETVEEDEEAGACEEHFGDGLLVGGCEVLDVLVEKVANTQDPAGIGIGIGQHLTIGGCEAHLALELYFVFGDKWIIHFKYAIISRRCSAKCPAD